LNYNAINAGSAVGSLKRRSNQRHLAVRRLWYAEPAKLYSRSNDAVIRVYDEAGNVIETHEHAGEFREP